MLERIIQWRFPVDINIKYLKIGVYVHGHRKIETYRLDDLWCIHLYRYEAELELAGRRLPIRPGYAGLIGPGVEMTYHFRGRSPHLCVHFALGQSGPRGGLLIPAMQSLGDRFESTYLSLGEAIGWVEAQPARAAARVVDVLWQLSDGARVAGGPSSERAEVSGARALIERRLTEPLRTPAIARAVGLSHNHLLRLFHEATGYTLAGYIRHRRAQRARHLLLRSNMPINAIAASVGVADLQAFNKLIRREFGHSPRALRRGAQGGGPAAGDLELHY